MKNIMDTKKNSKYSTTDHQKSSSPQPPLETTTAAAAAAADQKKDEKTVMLVAIDDSEHSNYALRWTLDKFFSQKTNNDTHLFNLVIVHARPSTSAVGAAGPQYTGDSVDSELGEIAGKVVQTAKELCSTKSVNDVVVDVMEGDPRNVVCDAVEKHNASILVMGTHGYGTLKRAVFGSVSDYCVHHAHCSVMVVKMHKNKP